MTEVIPVAVGEEALAVLAAQAARLPDLFWPGVLEWLSAPGKPENEIRDALARSLKSHFQDRPGIAVKREYAVHPGAIDLVVESDSRLVLVGEHKACFGFDGIAANGAWLRRQLDKDVARVRSMTPVDGVGYLFVSAASPMGPWSEAATEFWNPAYHPGLIRHVKGGDTVAYRDQAEAAIAELLGEYGAVTATGRHHLVTRAGPVDLSWWLARVRSMNGPPEAGARPVSSDG